MTDSSTPQPSERDRHNAARRQEIAARQNAEYDRCLGLAVRALGPGWQPWMKIVLVDAAHRRTGADAPVAIAYKVYCGKQRCSENATFIREMPDGTIRQADRYEPLFAELLQEKHPAHTIEVRGQAVPVARYQAYWSALERYHPRSAEQLTGLRQSRQRSKTEKAEQMWREQAPLFTSWAEQQSKEEPGSGESQGR